MWKIVTGMAALILGSPGAALAAPGHDDPPLLPPTGYVGSWAENGPFPIVNLADNSRTELDGDGTGRYTSVLAPDESVVYLIGSGGTGQVEVYDPVAASITNTIPLGATDPPAIYAAVISPDGRWLYAADKNNSVIYKIDTLSPYDVTAYPVGSAWFGLALNRDGSRLYVSGADHKVYILNTSTGTQAGTSPLTFDDAVWDLTLSPDGSRVLAPVAASDRVYSINTSTDAVTAPITVPVSGSPTSTLYSPDGKWTFVTGQTGKVWRYSAGTLALEASLDTGYGDVYRAALNPNGTKLYLVSMATEQLIPIDLVGAVGQVLGVAEDPLPGASSATFDLAVGGVMAPAPPSITAAVLGTAGQATVAFTDGADGGYEIVDHTVSWTGGTQSCPSSPCAITGLTATSYTFTVHATNQAGDSIESAPVTASSTTTPAATAPDAPVITAATPGDGQVTLVFQDGKTNGAAITTRTAAWTAGGPAQTAACPPSPCVITGLTNGTGYTFTLRAANSAGTSPASAATAVVTPVKAATLPAAPTGLAGTPTATTITLSFGEPAGTITGYQASTDGGAHWAALAKDRVITGLTPSTEYRVSVRAVNAAGPGPAATAVTVRTGAPAMAAPTVVAGVSSLAVRWTKPAVTGVTGYTVTAKPGPATCTTTDPDDTDCVLGATAGTSYTVTVAVLGASVGASSASKAVTPTAPAVPGKLPGDAKATLTTTKGKITSAVRGQKLTLTGSGFAAYSTVRIAVYGKAKVLATVVTDAKGKLTRQVTLPNSLATAQKHSLLAAGVDASGRTRRLSMTFTVKR
ncbi:fibronectin type III domain-containing protein [Actinoplanes sp. NPDC051851]|uniref:fibronectin type III domain-containing protein n=1 Tax=Actinoplanes sp. NPDC051851 TaxID=3154753 RepID=UPI0034415ABB